jgi:hypothetical protein
VPLFRYDRKDDISIIFYATCLDQEKAVNAYGSQKDRVFEVKRGENVFVVQDDRDGAGL